MRPNLGFRPKLRLGDHSLLLSFPPGNEGKLGQFFKNSSNEGVKVTKTVTFAARAMARPNSVFFDKEKGSQQPRSGPLAA